MFESSTQRERKVKSFSLKRKMTPGLVTLLHFMNWEEIIIIKKKHQVFQRKTCCCKWLGLLLSVCREVPRNNCCGFWNDLFPRDYFEENVTQSTRCIKGALARKMHGPGCWCSIPKGFPVFMLFSQYESLVVP